MYFNIPKAGPKRVPAVDHMATMHLDDRVGVTWSMWGRKGVNGCVTEHIRKRRNINPILTSVSFLVPAVVFGIGMIDNRGVRPMSNPGSAPGWTHHGPVRNDDCRSGPSHRTTGYRIHVACMVKQVHLCVRGMHGSMARSPASSARPLMPSLAIKIICKGRTRGASLRWIWIWLYVSTCAAARQAQCLGQLGVSQSNTAHRVLDDPMIRQVVDH